MYVINVYDVKNKKNEELLNDHKFKKIYYI